RPQPRSARRPVRGAVLLPVRPRGRRLPVRAQGLGRRPARPDGALHADRAAGAQWAGDAMSGAPAVVLTVSGPSLPTPRTVPLAFGQRVVFGRGTQATIPLADEEASRLHVELALTPHGVEATDLASG